jgi:hypothetical protein
VTIGWLANALQITGLICLGQRLSCGWLFGIAAECLWLVRADEMNMPDLIFISGVYIGIAGWNFYNWRRV